MTQSWTEDSFASGHVGQTDLQNMENNFITLKSCFSGATQPSNQVAFQLWGHSSNNVLKMRSSDDSEWWGQMHGDASQKIPVYRNSAMDGWVVDGTITDKLVGIKGGSVYTTGGSLQGTWNQPDHVLTEAELPAHDHPYPMYENETTSAPLGAGRHKGGISAYGSTSEAGGGGAHNHGSSYRPYAAVHTMQYMNL